MVTADFISRTLISPREIPVGDVTAIIGAPFFAYVYFRKCDREFSAYFETCVARDVCCKKRQVQMERTVPCTKRGITQLKLKNVSSGYGSGKDKTGGFLHDISYDFRQGEDLTGSSVRTDAGRPHSCGLHQGA